jgi:hypothetical protein
VHGRLLNGGVLVAKKASNSSRYMIIVNTHRYVNPNGNLVSEEEEEDEEEEEEGLSLYADSESIGVHLATVSGDIPNG